MNTSPHNRKHLALWLAAIFGAFHLIFMGLSTLEVDWRGGEGLIYATALLDGPWLVLCHNRRVVDDLLYGSQSRLLLVGTVIYALVGFVIGAVIDWIRALIARHRGAE